MTGHGNRCQCRCGTCKQLPEGFKLLHPSTRKRHLAAEAKADSKFRTSASPSLLPSTPPLSPPSSPLHHSSRSEHLHSPSQHGEVPLVAPSDDSSKLSSTACCSNACPMEAVRREAVKEAVAIRTSGHREGEIQGKSTYQAVKQDDIGSSLLLSRRIVRLAHILSRQSIQSSGLSSLSSPFSTATADSAVSLPASCSASVRLFSILSANSLPFASSYHPLPHRAILPSFPSIFVPPSSISTSSRSSNSRSAVRNVSPFTLSLAQGPPAQPVPLRDHVPVILACDIRQVNQSDCSQLNASTHGSQNG